MSKSQAPITNYLPEKLPGLRIKFAVLFFFVPNESQMASGTGLVRDSLDPPLTPVSSWMVFNSVPSVLVSGDTMML